MSKTVKTEVNLSLNFTKLEIRLEAYPGMSTLWIGRIETKYAPIEEGNNSGVAIPVNDTKGFVMPPQDLGALIAVLQSMKIMYDEEMVRNGHRS